MIAFVLGTKNFTKQNRVLVGAEQHGFLDNMHLLAALVAEEVGELSGAVALATRRQSAHHHKRHSCRMSLRDLEKSCASIQTK